MTSEVLSRLAAWLLVATGFILTYEVLARYVFNAPTIWAAEVSQLLLICGVFLALGRTLHRREDIAIAILQARLTGRARRIAESVTLAFIAAFAGIVTWWGFDIAWDSLVKGRSTGTMLNIPNWWAEALIPLGFGLLALQAGVEILRIWTGAGWGSPPAGDPET